MILCGNPKEQYLHYRTEIDAAIAAVLENGRYILGDQVRGFEQEFAGYIHTSDAVGCGSGTEALHLALAACGIGVGDEVITVSHTAVATVSAIEMCGATPVLCDIDPLTYTIDPGKVEALITQRTRAIIPVHIYGQAADLEPLLAIATKHKLRLIEDCAQAHGAKYQGKTVGSFADLSCFSFYPTKNLGALGDGGLVATSNPELAERLRLLREYGWKQRYQSEISGWNSRLDELQAAVLRIKLRHLDEDNAKRRGIAEAYNKGLAGLPIELPTTRKGSEHVFHLYVIRSAKRDALKAHLETQKIFPLVHYPVPIHRQPAYQDTLGKRALPVTEQAAAEILSLPMYPELRDSEVTQVIEAIQTFHKTGR